MAEIMTPVQATALIESMLKEITGLRASVAKYKKRAELANARADKAEENMRTALSQVAIYEKRMREIRQYLHGAVERTG